MSTTHAEGTPTHINFGRKVRRFRFRGAWIRFDVRGLVACIVFAATAIAIGVAALVSGE